jgi:transposase
VPIVFSESSALPVCSRASVYRTASAYRRGHLDPGLEAEAADPAAPPRAHRASLKRSLVALLKRAPAAFGWCHTRWSCACLAAELKARRGVAVSQDTVRRWLREAGYAWKRARHAARDDDPERAAKLARVRHLCETLPRDAALFFADELDIHLLPRLGCEWMLRGTQREVLTPGTNQKNYPAGALNYLTGQLVSVISARKNRWLFIDLLRLIGRAYPATKFTRIYVVVDNYVIHKARAVAAWLTQHPRFELVRLPAYCPRANPIERAFGDVHDKCPRNHKRRVLAELVEDVRRRLRWNGPWRYRLSELYYAPEVEAALAETERRARIEGRMSVPIS